MVYAQNGLDVPFEEIVGDVERNEDGGTLAVFLGRAALARGLRARIHSWNLRIFDPTWWRLEPAELAEKLDRRAQAVRSKRLGNAILAYAGFVRSGGELGFADPTPALLREILDDGHPVIAGLSSTYLYAEMRERPNDMKQDDVRGEPTGHFVVVRGYRKRGREFLVSDPFVRRPENRRASWLPAERLVHSILLGVLTDDGVLLEVWR